MKITPDKHFDQRWIVQPEPIMDRNDNLLIQQRSLLMAARKDSGSEHDSLGKPWPKDDFWFHPYAARRLKGFGDSKPLLAWLKAKKAHHVWQPVSTGTYFSEDGPMIGIDYSRVALVLIDRGKAMLFKLNITLFTEQEE